MRYDRHLERGALAASLLAPGVASEVWITLPVPPRDRELFRASAASAARRRRVHVRVDDEDGVTTAAFSREDRAAAAV